MGVRFAGVRRRGESGPSLSAVTVGKLSLLRIGLRSLDLLSPEPGGGNPWVTPFNALVSASASPARV